MRLHLATFNPAWGSWTTATIGRRAERSVIKRLAKIITSWQRLRKSTAMSTWSTNVRAAAFAEMAQRATETAQAQALRVLKGIVRRMQQAQLGRAWQTWKSAFLAAQRQQDSQAQKLQRVIAWVSKRWRQQQLGGGLRTWTANVLKQGAHEKASHKMSRLVARWQRRLLSSAFRGWDRKKNAEAEAEAAQKAKLNRLLKHMQQRKLHLAWNGWAITSQAKAEKLKASKVMVRGLKRWELKQYQKAYRQWTMAVGIHRSEAALRKLEADHRIRSMVRVLRRLAQVQVAACMTKWVGVTFPRRFRGGLLAVMRKATLRRWERQKLQSGFSRLKKILAGIALESRVRRMGYARMGSILRLAGKSGRI